MAAAFFLFAALATSADKLVEEALLELAVE